MTRKAALLSGVLLCLAVEPARSGELRPFAPPPEIRQSAPAPRAEPFQWFRQQATQLTAEEREELTRQLEQKLHAAKDQGNDGAAYRYWRFLRILEEQP